MMGGNKKLETDQEECIASKWKQIRTTEEADARVKEYHQSIDRTWLLGKTITKGWKT